MDWESKARKLAESLGTLGAVLALIGVYQAWHAEGWAMAGWLLMVWLGASAFDDARI